MSKDLREYLNKEKSIEEIADSLFGHAAQQKHYGYWQLCPKCEGDGNIYSGSTTTLRRTCPVCKGEGKLIRPVINDKND